MIPAEAVEALARVLAQESLVEADMAGAGWDAENDDPAPFMPRARERAGAYLEAAAPYMLSHEREQTRLAHLDAMVNRETKADELAAEYRRGYRDGLTDRKQVTK